MWHVRYCRTCADRTRVHIFKVHTKQKDRAVRFYLSLRNETELNTVWAEVYSEEEPEYFKQFSRYAKRINKKYYIGRIKRDEQSPE